MKPVAHPTNTREIGAPADHDQSILNIQALPITDAMMVGIPALVSYWRPDAEELATLNAGAPLRLWIVGGRNMPPVWIDMDEAPAQLDGMTYRQRIYNRASTKAPASVIRVSLSEIAAEADGVIAQLRAEVERLNLLVMQGEGGRAEAARAEAAYRDAETLLTADDEHAVLRERLNHLTMERDRLMTERDALRVCVETIAVEELSAVSAECAQCLRDIGFWSKE